MDSDIRYGEDLGVDDYLTKPIRSADLLAVARGKLHHAQQLAQSSAQPALPLTLGQRSLTVGRLQSPLANIAPG